MFADDNKIFRNESKIVQFQEDINHLLRSLDVYVCKLDKVWTLNIGKLDTM